MAESLNAGFFIVGSPLRPTSTSTAPAPVTAATGTAASTAAAAAMPVYAPEGCLSALLRLWALGVQRRRSLLPIDPAEDRETEYMSVLVLQQV